MIGSANHAAQRNIASCLPAKSIPKEKKVRWLNQERMTLIIVPIIAPPSPRGWVSHLKQKENNKRKGKWGEKGMKSIKAETKILMNSNQNGN